MRARIVVIGVGNDFRHDDATGWSVIDRLVQGAERLRLPAETVLRVCGGDPARLISLWEGADLAVVIDSARADPARPGRVHRFVAAHGPDIAGHGSASSHGLGLGDAIDLARRLDLLPGRLVVYAVEGADFSLGTGMTKPVAAAVGVVSERIAREISGYVRSFAAGSPMSSGA